MKSIDLGKPHKFFFETLGNQTRWDIVHLLLKKSHRATDIAEKLGYEQSLISHHLKRLLTCGFVKVKKNGLERIYRINKETISPLLKLVEKHVNRYCSKFCLPRSVRLRRTTTGTKRPVVNPVRNRTRTFLSLPHGLVGHKDYNSVNI